MNFNFLPSLQQMSTVKVAVHLYYDDEIQKMLHEEQNLPETESQFDRNRNAHWFSIKKLGKNKLHYLPKSLQTQVTKLIRPINTRVFHWEQHHNFILRQISEIPFKYMLHWKTNGMIDREQTAKVIVRNADVHETVRFIMACMYFMEEEIIYIWNMLTETDKKRESYHHTNAAVRFWVKYLNEGVGVHWSQMVEEYFGPLVLGGSLRKNQYPLHLSSFFPFLSQENKGYWVFRTLRTENYDSDLQCCFLQLDENERKEIFNSAVIIRVLCYLLEWPFQILFLSTAKRLWCYMNVNYFDYVLNAILFYRILKGLDDFDYLQLFKEFWNIAPDSFKIVLKRERRYFKVIQLILNHNSKTAKRSLQAIVYKYYPGAARDPDY